MEEKEKNAIKACDSSWVTTILRVERSGKCGGICNIQAGSRASC